MQERMWRIEAIYKLGRMKFNVGTNGRPGDQKAAEGRLVRMAELESDPLIKKAADQAAKLTQQEYGRYRSVE
jgi:hypothetical protein